MFSVLLSFEFFIFIISVFILTFSSFMFRVSCSEFHVQSFVFNIEANLCLLKLVYNVDKINYNV